MPLRHTTAHSIKNALGVGPGEEVIRLLTYVSTIMDAANPDGDDTPPVDMTPSVYPTDVDPSAPVAADPSTLDPTLQADPGVAVPASSDPSCLLPPASFLAQTQDPDVEPDPIDHEPDPDYATPTPAPIPLVPSAPTVQDPPAVGPVPQSSVPITAPIATPVIPGTTSAPAPVAVAAPVPAAAPFTTTVPVNTSVPPITAPVIAPAVVPFTAPPVAAPAPAATGWGAPPATP